ncbi:MAG: glycoside hydrolase family 3 C-terminal domain-containing protein [Clostridia bacterium]|nr:glycoside hydrolase family 3 C-terminal domain-containing protein [Clostridia bacterium]
MKLSTRFGEIFLICSTSFLAVMLALSVAGSQNASMINSFFNTQNYRVEEREPDPDAPEEDTEYFKQTYGTEEELRAAYESLCRETEEEGIVLLKNEGGALPLDRGSKVSLFGSGSGDFYYYTSGSSTPSNVGTYATLKEALEKKGADGRQRLDVNGALWDFYRSSAYTSSYGHSKSTTKINEAPYSALSGLESSFSQYGDAAIVTITRESGEGSDMATKGSDGLDGSYLSISANEQDLLRNLTKLKSQGVFSRIIVLLNSAVGIQLDFLDSATEAGSGIDVDACLWTGVTGSHGAEAIGEVLVGDVNPSGRAADTFAKNNFSSPAMANWMNSLSPNGKLSGSVAQAYSNYNDFPFINSTSQYYEVYAEGIYVGYRYYETRYEDYVMGSYGTGAYDYGADVAYPFGYGLSYSDFSYSNFTATENEEDSGILDVSVTVSNNSPVPGREVVQIYLQKPYSEYDKENGVEKASVELAGYAKTGTLAAKGEEGDSETVTITVDKEQFKSYDSSKAETYILDKGDYYLTAAKDAHDAVNNILAAKGYAPGNTSGRMDAEGRKDLAEDVLTQEDTDTAIYAKSAETGVKITNRLDNADVNRYEGSGTNSVTYVSRSNWSGTWPESAITLSIATETMQKDLQSVTDASQADTDEAGYAMPAYGASNGMTLIMLRGYDYDDGVWDRLLDQTTFAEQSRLITDGLHLTNAVTSVAKPQTGDNNGPTSVTGSVTGYCMPSEGIWAASFNDELIERIGSLMGDDSIMAGVQGLYAPGANIHRTPFCGRAHEYFSEDPYLSGMASVAEIKGIQDRGVVAYVKHVAFNECETYRSGVGVWLNEQSAREIYLLPFEYSMRPSMGNAHAAMTSFNRAGCTWTSGDYNLLTGICREEFGFDGFYITDMASGNGAYYMTYYDGIMAGTCLYDGSGSDTALDGFRNSPRFCRMMREATHRILYVVCNFSAAMNGYSSNTKLVPVTPWWQILLTTLEVIAIVLTVGSAAVYVVAEVLRHRKDTGNSPDESG